MLQGVGGLSLRHFSSTYRSKKVRWGGVSGSIGAKRTARRTIEGAGRRQTGLPKGFQYRYSPAHVEHYRTLSRAQDPRKDVRSTQGGVVEIPDRRGERLPRMKKTMFRRRWIVVITSMVLIAVTILLGYGPAVAYRYSGFTDSAEASAHAAGRAGPDRPRRTDVPLLLGHRESEERARPRSLSDAVVREHRGGRLRAHCVSDRRRARLRHARPGARARADDAALPAGTRRRAQRANGMAGYKGFFYHFLDMTTGARYDDSELSTVDTALLLAGVLFCQSYFDGDASGGSRDPPPRRRALPARRLAAGRRRARRRSASAGSPKTASSTTTGAATTKRCSCTCSRSARPPFRSAPTRGDNGRAAYDRTGARVRAGAPRLRAAVRPPVLARLDRLPRHPGRLHARRAASTTSRTAGARCSRSAPTRSRNPRGCKATARTMWGLTASDGPAT